jgi:plastocyanin
MKKFLILVLALVIIIGVVLAVTKKSNNNNSQPNYNQNSSSQSNAQPNNSSSSNGAIDIKNMMFTPSQISIQKGGTVTWTNHDTTTHTVIDDLSSADGPHSGDIPPGGTYSFTFNKTGSFQYHCNIHPSMRGTIVVK